MYIVYLYTFGSTRALVENPCFYPIGPHIAYLHKFLKLIYMTFIFVKYYQEHEADKFSKLHNVILNKCNKTIQTRYINDGASSFTT